MHAAMHVLRIFLLPLAVLVACSTHTAVASPTFATISPMTKVSTSLRETWTDAKSWHARRRWAECFVKIRGPYDAAAEKTLKQTGFKARSVVGAQGGASFAVILTGTVRLKDLFALADLDAVESIEGAVPMGKKGPRVLK